MLKSWRKLRGYKRHAGAIVMALTIIIPMFGVEIPDNVMQQIQTIGTMLFGIGWLDKGKRVLQGEK